jgi:hypothetical protein
MTDADAVLGDDAQAVLELREVLAQQEVTQDIECRLP